MSRHAVGARATGVGTDLLPLGSLYSPSGNGGVIREVGVWNTSAVGVAVALRRLTTAATQGAGLAELDLWNEGPPATMTGFQTHTSTGPTITAGFLRRAVLAAAIGSGIIWTFGGNGLVVPAGVAEGVGLTIPDGTGQILDWYIEWEE